MNSNQAEESPGEKAAKTMAGAAATMASCGAEFARAHKECEKAKAKYVEARKRFKACCIELNQNLAIVGDGEPLF